MNGPVKIFLIVLFSAALFLISAGKIYTGEISGRANVQGHEATGQAQGGAIIGQGQALPLWWNNNAVDSAVSLLKSGNVVLRSGLGATSHMLALMNQKEKTYSHCGIVMIEHGYPFVYHAIGGEDNPDARLRRDSAKHFFSPVHNDGIAIVSYEFNSKTTEELARIVAQYYIARPKFDMKFDLKTDDALYCSEFVYKALNKATGDTCFIKPTKVFSHVFVGIDDLFLNPRARFVCQIKFK